jgi:hypothetical protein
MPVERKTKTVADVITAVKRQFGDESSVQINNSDIIRWVNDAQVEIAIKNPEVNAGMVQINVVANQTVYPLLTNIPDILIVHSIHFDGQYLENLPFTDAQQTIIRSGDTTTTDTPYFWYEYAGTMNLWPKPNASKALGLTVFYSKQPTLITTDSAPLTVADSYFKAIVDYCLTQAHELDENFSAAQVKAQQFETSLQVQANRTHAQDAFYPRIQLLPEDDIY